MENTKLENWNGFAIRFVYVKDEWQAVLKDVAEALNYGMLLTLGEIYQINIRGHIKCVPLAVFKN